MKRLVLVIAVISGCASTPRAPGAAAEYPEREYTAREYTAPPRQQQREPQFTPSSTAEDKYDDESKPAAVQKQERPVCPGVPTVYERLSAGYILYCLPKASPACLPIKPEDPKALQKYEAWTDTAAGHSGMSVDLHPDPRCDQLQVEPGMPPSAQP